MVGGRVVGVGRTPRAARVAAKRSRPKDNAVVVWVGPEGRVHAVEKVTQGDNSPGS